MGRHDRVRVFRLAALLSLACAPAALAGPAVPPVQPPTAKPRVCGPPPGGGRRAVVVTSLKDAGAYRALCPRFAAAFDYLERTDLAKAATGRHEIDGDRVFALVNDYTTKPEGDLRYEHHRRYIDLQYVVSGVEQIGWAPVASLRADPYDAERDIAFLDGTGSLTRMPAGQAMLLWPEDAHKPGIADGEPSAVRKVVIKIAVD